MRFFNFLSSRFVTYAPTFILGKSVPLKLESNFKSLVISILLKFWSRTKKFYYILFLLFGLLFQQYLLPLKKFMGFTNEAAKSAKTAPRNPPSCFFISCFIFSVTSSTNTPESSTP